MITRIVLMCAAIALLPAGCGGGGEGAPETTVAAGFYPLAYLAEQIGGDRVSVRNLTPSGAEPHDLELTPGDVQDVRAADLVLYLGHGFQPALEDAVRERDTGAVDLLDGLELVDGGDAHGHGGGEAGHDDEREADHEGEGLDPHVWLDPVRYARMAGAVAEALGDPALADDLVARLEELDGELRAGLASCERRAVVTSHAAFGYLARRYGLEQIPLTGLSPEAEPSPRAIESLVDEVREEGATTVFFETLVSPSLARTVAREAGVRTAVLDPLEGLSDERLEAGADYFSVMRENLSALREALGCR